MDIYDRSAYSRKPDETDTMKTIVQVNIYRLQGDTPEFLLFKRAKDSGENSFWQPASKEITGENSIADTMSQTLEERAGVRAYKRLSAEIYTYEWYDPKENGGQQGRDVVFAVELETNVQITVDPHRYSNYAWFSYDEAVQKLKWNGNIEALRRLRDRIGVEIIAAGKAKVKAQAAEEAARIKAEQDQHTSFIPTLPPEPQPTVNLANPYGSQGFTPTVIQIPTYQEPDAPRYDPYAAVDPSQTPYQQP